MNLRCACYMRISTSMQNPLSPDDQLRKCREFAGVQGWTVLDTQVYSDHAISGAGSDRPGLTRMMHAASSKPRPFDVVLVDDSSRLSRSLGDAVRIFERLNFAGVRVIAVSQGIDTQSEQADVLVTVHGLVDSLYVKELAKKTHRGLEGKLLRGLHAGGRCFGYDVLDAEGGKRLAINKAEAATVQKIFELSAKGLSLKSIAKALNAERIGSPRPRKGRPAAGWCPTAIREMLHNERYAGLVVWNRSKFVKVPGTNRRVARPRPVNEWKTQDAPHLRIVPEELWTNVQDRLQWVKETFTRGRPRGLVSRSATSKYLFSGILVCAQCGGNLRIITGHGKSNHPRWGCPRNFNRGTCSNALRERNDRVEPRLLAGLQESVLQHDVVDYTLNRFEVELDRQLRAMSGQLDGARRRKLEVEAEVGRLAEAVAQQGAMPALMRAISARQAELQELEQKLWGTGPGTVKSTVEEIRTFVHSRLQDIRKVLNSNVESARFELLQHVSQISMRPVVHGDAGYYIAEGEWDLLGNNKGRLGTAAPRNLEMVAGVGFEPTTFGL